MKILIKQLEKQLEKIEEKIDKREDTFWDRSDNWQESDKGVDFECQTNDLENIRDEIAALIDSAEDFVSNWSKS